MAFRPARNMEYDLPLGGRIIRGEMKKFVLVKKPKRQLELSLKWQPESFSQRRVI